jgi:hypothetical protein
MQPNSPPGFDKYQVSSFAGLNVHAAEEAGNTPPRAGNERGRNAALQRGQAFLSKNRKIRCNIEIDGNGRLSSGLGASMYPPGEAVL